MAAKRGKSQAKRNSGGGGGGMSGWAWLVIGLALGIGVILLAPKFLDGKGAGFFRADPKPDAPTAVDANPDDAPLVDDSGPAVAPTEPKDEDYDFYTLLPGEETALSDTELADRARAEEAARQAAEPQTPAPTPTAPDAATAPAAIDAKTPPAIDAPASTPPKPDTATAAEPRGDARYILQAGAFAASGDAEALKAKIAFLGLGARVESAQIQGKTVYRVRMGPYGTATELADAKRKLSGGGLPAMAIKVK
ncbi:SPOR domain-containing protein [Lysobacter hankyongensis]|uniref:SPOR domain-containing protein n=1 Tax=Lysobacter hankyongensis TaxID=1176535 RepID=A0ABP9AXT9_9GAMM